jgi:hypothetical protein
MIMYLVWSSENRAQSRSETVGVSVKSAEAPAWCEMGRNLYVCFVSLLLGLVGSMFDLCRCVCL